MSVRQPWPMRKLESNGNPPETVKASLGRSYFMTSIVTVETWMDKAVNGLNTDTQRFMTLNGLAWFDHRVEALAFFLSQTILCKKPHRTGNLNKDKLVSPCRTLITSYLILLPRAVRQSVQFKLTALCSNTNKMPYVQVGAVGSNRGDFRGPESSFLSICVGCFCPMAKWNKCRN